jgi:hypothetical protein
MSSKLEVYCAFDAIENKVANAMVKANGKNLFFIFIVYFLVIEY